MTKNVVSGFFSLVIGCGYTSQRSSCRCNEVVAIDIDKEKILRAKEGDRDAHYVVCDARSLPLRSGCFEDLVCTDVLEHIADYREVLFNIAELEPRFIYLRYPTETREKLLIKGSRIYREQHWGKIHVTIVKTRRVVDVLERKSYNVEVEFALATSTFTRLILQGILELFGFKYKIPDVGLLSFSEDRSLFRFLVFLSGYLGYLMGHVTRFLIHDNVILYAEKI
jgi:hypothetical protein